MREYCRKYGCLQEGLKIDLDNFEGGLEMLSGNLEPNVQDIIRWMVKISGKDFEFVFEHLESKTINREAVKDILLDIAQGKHIDLNKYKQVDNKEIETKLKEIISKHKGASFSALMGEAMKEFRGSVSGQEVMKALKKLLEQK